jgi:SAM-dependent methyltransferase
MAVPFYQGHRDKRLLAYLDPQKNTKGREYMNTIVIPRFAKFFKNDDVIYNIGQHVFWDYSYLFNNFEKRCNYLTVDIDPTQGEPDVIDDITDSKIESESADGMIYVGMSDVVHDHPKAIEHIYRILKPGGRLLFSFHGGGQRYLKDTNVMGILDMLKAFTVDEMYMVYGPGGLDYGEMYTDGNLDSSFYIVRKPKV